MSAYLSSLRARSMPMNKTEIDQLPPDVILKNLLACRDSLFRSLQYAKKSQSESSPLSTKDDLPKDDSPKDESTDINCYTSNMNKQNKDASSVPPINKTPNSIKTISQHLISIRTKWYREHFQKPHIDLVTCLHPWHSGHYFRA